MKKILLSTTLFALSIGLVQAYPNMDYSYSAAPFALMQQRQFERTEIQDYHNRQRAAKEQYNEAIGEQPEIPVKQQTQLQLKNSDPTNFQQPLETRSNNKSYLNRKFEEDDGKIFIKFWED